MLTRRHEVVLRPLMARLAVHIRFAMTRSAPGSCSGGGRAAIQMPRFVWLRVGGWETTAGEGREASRAGATGSG